jgi:diphthamide synthase (EF-2-diphthine--ammonia ligase)
MKTLLSWSSGKDSAWALHLLRQRDDIEVVGLVTTINAAFDRVAMHGVRRALVEAQADAAALPLHLLTIPYPCPNETYEAIMGEFVARQAAAGVEAMAFGDLFLEDIRRYRETKLAGTGIAPIFPVWSIPTARLAQDMIAGGLIAHVACLDPRKLPAGLAGRRFDPISARRIAARRRPLRRERRVPHVLLGRSHVPALHPHHRRRARHPRRLRVLRLAPQPPGLRRGAQA